MHFWVGVTDPSWYRFLAAGSFDEVNFWQPSATPPFVGRATGLPFLFKLRGRENAIAGGGHFVTYSRLPIRLAWEVFGPKNGAADFETFQEMVGGHRHGAGAEIGCSIVSNVFFLSPDKWLRNPVNWQPTIVRGRFYDTGIPEEQALWDQVLAAAQPHGVNDPNREPKFGDPVQVRPRLGQGSFRVLVTDAYRRRCAITGESTLVTLEAAHIIPYAGEGTHDPRNGMLLRADFHRLFDVGLVGVSPDLRIQISPRIRELYSNGKAYYRVHDQPLSVVPDAAHLRPDPDRLHWHMSNRYQG